MKKFFKTILRQTKIKGFRIQSFYTSQVKKNSFWFMFHIFFIEKERHLYFSYTKKKNFSLFIKQNVVVLFLPLGIKIKLLAS